MDLKDYMKSSLNIIQLIIRTSQCKSPILNHYANLFNKNVYYRPISHGQCLKSPFNPTVLIHTTIIRIMHSVKAFTHVDKLTFTVQNISITKQWKISNDFLAGKHKTHTLNYVVFAINLTYIHITTTLIQGQSNS